MNEAIMEAIMERESQDYLEEMEYLDEVETAQDVQVAEPFISPF